MAEVVEINSKLDKKIDKMLDENHQLKLALIDIYDEIGLRQKTFEHMKNNPLNPGEKENAKIILKQLDSLRDYVAYRYILYTD